MISFIIPVYNKGTVLYKTLTSLLFNLKKHALSDYEIILINDGSTDNSYAEAKRFKKICVNPTKIKIYHYTKNIGKGFALRFGFAKSLGDPVVFIDGDLDISSKSILRAIRAYQEQDTDVVIASKYHKASRTFYPKIRFLYSLVLRSMIKFLFNLSVSDTQVGLKVFRREVLSRVFPKLIIKRFAVDLELLVVAISDGFTNIREVPVVIYQGSSRTSTIDLWAVKNFCQDILAIFYRKNILRFYGNKKNIGNTSPEPSFAVYSS